MKKFVSMLALSLWFVLAAVGGIMAADAVAPVAAQPNVFNDVLAWLVSHQVVIGMLLIGILDFIFSINPEWKSNSIGHLVYLFAQKLSGKPADPTPPA